MQQCILDTWWPASWISQLTSQTCLQTAARRVLPQPSHRIDAVERTPSHICCQAGRRASIFYTAVCQPPQAALAVAFIVEGLLLGFHLKGSPLEVCTAGQQHRRSQNTP